MSGYARILELKERAAVRAEVTTQSLIDQAEQVFPGGYGGEAIRRCG
jgi:hypothetical protein